MAPLRDFKNEDGTLKALPSLATTRVHVNRVDTITEDFKKKVTFPLRHAFRIYADSVKDLDPETIIIDEGEERDEAVSYTHLTLPTICSV